MTQPLRICFFGTYRATYSRNQIMIHGLRSQGAEVYECHATLWHGIEDRVEQASGGWMKPAFWGRVIRTYFELLRQYRQAPDYDVLLIGYPGQFDAYLARLLTWWARKPMALDILMSLYLVAEERGLTEKSPLTGWLIFLLEKMGLSLPDLLIAENGAYQAYYCRQYNLPPTRFQHVPHGADNRIFYPRPMSPPTDHFVVSYHGMYLPSHGLDIVIQAAHLLQDHPRIRFQFFGQGPEKDKLEAYVHHHQLANVIFRGFVSRDELLDGLAQSHVCLGVFGMTKQSHYTIQNKVWEGLAMARPVVSGDSQVVRDALTHQEHIYLVERNNPTALADALAYLAEHPTEREAMAQTGYAYLQANNTLEGIGGAMYRALQTIAPTS